MLKKVLLTLLFLLPSVAYANTITIQGIDPGGQISTYQTWYERMQKAHDKLVIDGVCVSACTVFFAYLPPEDVCMTDRAVLGIHMTSGNEPHDGEMTEIFVRQIYPKWLQDMIVEHGGLEEWPFFLDAEDVYPHIQMCPGYSVPDKRTYVKEQEENSDGDTVSLQEQTEPRHIQPEVPAQ